MLSQCLGLYCTKECVKFAHASKLDNCVMTSFYYNTRMPQFVVFLCKLGLMFFKVTRPSYFVRVPSYFEALWYPHLYFDLSLTHSVDNYRSIYNIAENFWRSL